MRNPLLAWVGVLLLLPAGAGATAIGIPISHGGGPYLVGFEVESMADHVGDEDLRSVRYVGRFSARVGRPLTLYLRLGGSEIDVDSEVDFGSDAPSVPATFEGRPKLAVGAGGTYTATLPWRSLGFFADATFLHSLSIGRTEVTTDVESTVWSEEYQNRYRWFEYQAAAGLRFELPVCALYAGLVGRGVDGKIWRETYKTNELVSSSTEDFSRAFGLYGLAGFDIPLDGRLVFSVTGSASGGDAYTWTVALAEFSR